MMKKKVFQIFATIIACVLALFTSAMLISKSNIKKNGFDRKFIKAEFILEKEYELPNYFFEILSVSNNDVLLANLKDWLMPIRINLATNEMVDFNLIPPKNYDARVRSMDLDMLDSCTYLLNKRFNIAKISKNKATNYLVPKDLRLNDIRAISSNSVILKNYKYSKEGNSTELIKLSLNVTPVITESYLLPRKHDGIFDSDGKFFYEKEKHKLYYMYFYSGEFICLDTNLTELYKAKTIDTVKKPYIKLNHQVKSINNKSIHINSLNSPPKIINKYMTIHNNNVYILSNLKADNEDEEIKDAIDVYSTENGKYLYSLALPKFRNYNMRQFQIIDDKVVALYRNFLVIYHHERL